MFSARTAIREQTWQPLYNFWQKLDEGSTDVEDAHSSG